MGKLANPMRRIVICSIFMFFCLFLSAFQPLPSEADVGHVGYDIAGRWLMKGTGYGDKSGVRSELNLNGYLDIHTGVFEGRRCITGYDLKLRIDASKLDIKVWDKNSSERLKAPVPLRELRPTVSNPLELPPVETKDGLIYQVTLESETSGVVKIYGTLDLDVLGTTKFNSNSAIWKEGSEFPENYEDKSSGCDVGGIGAFGLLMGLLPFLRRRY
ncbi:MAG: hypothetical protein GX256_08810 [Fretibacterium sp.]|nr:hypothetical protein [Fretibacterium sp.]